MKGGTEDKRKLPGARAAKRSGRQKIKAIEVPIGNRDVFAWAAAHVSVLSEPSSRASIRETELPATQRDVSCNHISDTTHLRLLTRDSCDRARARTCQPVAVAVRLALVISSG